MARGPSAKNTREGRRTYPCGSIPLLPAIVLPRLAPLLMISPSNRKSDDTSIDHLFCLLYNWPQAKHVSQGCRFCLPLLPPGGLFWPIIAQLSGVRKRPFPPLFLARIHRTGWMTSGPLLLENRPPVLEQGRRRTSLRRSWCGGRWPGRRVGRCPRRRFTSCGCVVHGFRRRPWSSRRRL